ncbi:MAG: succinate dehydrogenase assembly factor 2 [Abyssibacter sp.]|jgi:antitoxin CptB|uniref:FAD assembly factor SdhE n=1 Tax=Abyssibacter sp. TaxID=2320200 RepID=UPI002EC0AE12|nr:succinate dehydrogenase assembly factor 2 [Pseudomonadota bacterium]
MSEARMPRGRLKWLCRRGMKEHDVLFERFLAQEYDQLAEVEQDAFIRLAEMEDPEVNAIFLGRIPAPDEQIRAIVDRMVQLRG